jgi:hypothetical protein
VRLPAITAIASFVVVALTAGASLAARSEGARSTFVVKTTVVDACAVTLEGAAIQAACAPGALARVGATAGSGLASVSLVRGGAPMRVASAVDGRTQVITFSF